MSTLNVNTEHDALSSCRTLGVWAWNNNNDTVVKLLGINGSLKFWTRGRTFGLAFCLESCSININTSDDLQLTPIVHQKEEYGERAPHVCITLHQKRPPPSPTFHLLTPSGSGHNDITGRFAQSRATVGL